MKKCIFLLLAVCASAVIAHSQSLVLKWKTDTIFRVPESVYYDARANVLYVSNIDGKSTEKDGKGFIAQVTPEGKVKDMNWVTGLDAPKGMGVYKNTLYIADLTRVVTVDIATGKKLDTYEIEGAEFLNDITVDAGGNVYISDSAKGRIHRLSGGKMELYFESPDFKRVNGLLALKDGLYVVDAGTGINYKLGADKKLVKYTETSQSADGIEPAGKDEYIVSSWNGEVFYVDASARAKKLIDTREQNLNSADIGYDPKTKTVFVPTFLANSVYAYTLTK